jgi:hypothetical protein
MGALEIAHTHMYICIHVYMYVTAKGALHKTLIQHGKGCNVLECSHKEVLRTEVIGLNSLALRPHCWSLHFK